MNDKIETLENAIRHINTAIDVDPWAKQTAVEAMRYMIASLVSKPQRMRGRWVEVTEDGICIFKVCDQCGKKPLWNEWRTDRCESNYCPNCGADMREGQDG